MSSELLQGALLGGALGIFMLTGASILLVSDRVVRGAGRLLDWFVHRVLRRPVPTPPLAERLVESRDFVRTALAESWKQAVPAALGNQLFDFLALYVSLLAVGSRVDPVLVLLAFVAGSALAMIPITPGRPRLRGSRAHRCAHAGRRHARARGAGDVALPAVLVLAAAPVGAGGLGPVPPPPPRARHSGLTRARSTSGRQ